MKTIIRSLALTALLFTGNHIAAAQTNIYILSWQDSSVPQLSQYSPGTNSVYKLYSTSTLGTAVTNWPLVATWTNWTIGPGNWYTNYYTNIAADTFFAITGSNVFKETPLFSAPTVHSGPPAQAPSQTALSVQ